MSLWQKSLVQSEDRVRKIRYFWQGLMNRFELNIYQVDFGAYPAPIRKNPSEVKNLSRRKTSYWDDRTGTVVIVDPGDADFGTAFRPTAGKEYFDSLR